MNTFDFTLEEDLIEEAEATQGGGSFGTLDTGIYPVTINFASLSTTEKGNNTLSLDITTDSGHRTTLWSIFGTIDKLWKSGSENYGYKDFQAFMAVAGAKSITPTPYSLKKEDGTLIKELSVVKELHGKKVTLAIQKELDIYNGNVSEKNIIHSSYNAKGQTYLEAKSGSPAEKVTKVGERLKDKESKRYKASLTQVADTSIEEEDDNDSLL
jgi:hypothetical protein